MNCKALNLLVRLIFLGLLPLHLIGCSPASPPVSYHSLVDFNPAPNTTETQSRLAILVGPVSIPDILKNSQITIGNVGQRFQRSEQHRWAGEIDHDFARAVGEQLANRLGTEQIAIFSMGQHLDPTHQIIFDVLAMDGALGKEANLALRWSLVDPKNKKAPVTRRSTFTEKPADDSYEAWVAAQRHNISRLSEEIAAVIKAEL
jgi:uncharacterized lipoprotein YmbA